MKNLTSNFKKAFEELKALGAPVFTPDDNSGYGQYTHDCCQFVMCDGYDTSYKFLDYYPISYSTWYAGTYSDEVHTILAKYGLYGEWANPEVLTICE